MEHTDWLRQEGEKRGLPVSALMLEQFQSYQAFLLDENKKYNLISEKDEPFIVTRHFLQSVGLLAVCDFPKGCRVADLGSGAGFPGLPMKIVRPDLDMVLVESIAKKARFLEMAIKRLGVLGARCMCGRMEDLGPSLEPVDAVVSRAVAEMEKLFRWSLPHLKRPGGKLIVIKGRKAKEEADSLRTGRDFRSGAFRVSIDPFNPFPDRAPLSDSWIVTVGS